MKRFFALLMAMITLISLSACVGGDGGSKDITQVADVASDVDTETASPDTTEPASAEISPDGYEVEAVRVGGLGELFIGGLNADKLYENRRNHLPILKFDTLDLLNNFIELNGKKYNLNRTINPYNGSLSFADTVKKYDEKFFEENTLLLVEKQATSGSPRYGVSEVYIKDEYCTVYVEMVSAPPQVTHDLANWFIVIPVTKSALKDVTEFDAIYGSGNTESQIEDDPDPTAYSPDGYEYVSCRVSSAGYTSDKYDDDGLTHLTISKFDSAEEVDSLVESTKAIYQSHMPHDYNVPSFKEIAERYDEKFFEDNVMFLVMKGEGTGSYRFGVGDIKVDGQKCTVYIDRLNNPELVTCDMAMWFISVAVPRTNIKNATEFDAVYRGYNK